MTKAKKNEIELDLSDRFFEKDGEFFIQSRVYKGNRGHKLIFEKVDKTKYDEFLNKLAKKLVEKSKLTAKRVVFEALRNMSKKELEKIEREIKKPKATKVSVEKGCLFLQVGKQDIPIVG